MSAEVTFGIDVTGLQGMLEGFDDLAVKVANQMLDKMQLAMDELVMYIVNVKLNGQVLNRKTGALAASITSEVYAGDGKITGRAFSDGSVPYAAIHEYGGTINIPTTVPVEAKYLRFVNGTYHKVSRAHPVQMPERSYMRSSLEEAQGHLTNYLTEEFSNIFKEAFGL